ncbi:hypothetical protein V6Z11_D11G038600 [Gossypium hirsutum]
MIDETFGVDVPRTKLRSRVVMITTEQWRFSVQVIKHQRADVGH